MQDVVLASVPIFGHVAPMTRLAAELVDAELRVRFLTGRRFEPLVVGAGAEFVPLPAEADFDDRTIAGEADKATRPDGVAGLRYDVANAFLRPARAQHEALGDLIRDPTDAVVVDPTFVGAALLAAATPRSRPPVVVAGVLPLPLDSAHTPPFGLGLSPLPETLGGLDRVRNGMLRAVVQRGIFGSVQRDYDRLFRDVLGTTAPTFVMNWMSRADAIVQFSVPAFEYPRPDATVPISFAGPMTGRSTSRSTSGELPSWWADLTDERPVVLVTQGPIANVDLDELIRPAVDALGETDVLLVVTTGGRPIDALGPLPGNVRAAEFVPYDQLMPHVDVLLTNGGYGGVHFALAGGIPVIVAGAGEDKPEVAARVAWSGVGIDLRTGRPSPRKISEAVRRVLDDPRYRNAARTVAQQIVGTEARTTFLETMAKLERDASPNAG